MSVLLTYDIKATTSTIHKELKDRLISVYRYQDRIQASNGTYALPNTTVTKNGVTPQQAAAEFLKACGEVRATWEKYIATEYSTTFAGNQ